MNKIKILVLVTTLSLFLVACHSNESIKTSNHNDSIKNIETITIGANHLKFSEEEELFDDAELIVIAKTDKNFMDREHIVTYIPSTPEDEEDLIPAIEDFHTKTPITIIDVLKQPKSSTIAKDDNMTIIEPVSLLENDDGLKRLSMEGYLEMDEGENYILYLKKNTFGEYSVINMNNGKFSLHSIDKINNTSQNKDEQKEHEDIKNDVKKRFEKEINELTK